MFSFCARIEACGLLLEICEIISTPSIFCLGGLFYADKNALKEEMKKWRSQCFDCGCFHKARILKFILILVTDYNLPSSLLISRYFTGKRGVEREILSRYPNLGTVLKPEFIYGKRKIVFEIPPDLTG
jgi:hypothetical protein